MFTRIYTYYLTYRLLCFSVHLNSFARNCTELSKHVLIKFIVKLTLIQQPSKALVFGCILCMKVAFNWQEKRKKGKKRKGKNENGETHITQWCIQYKEIFSNKVPQHLLLPLAESIDQIFGFSLLVWKSNVCCC